MNNFKDSILSLLYSVILLMVKRSSFTDNFLTNEKESLELELES